MSVVADRVGQTVVVTITENIADLQSLPAGDRKVAALERCHKALVDAIMASSRTDADLDAIAARAVADAARIKVTRPTGSL